MADKQNSSPAVPPVSLVSPNKGEVSFPMEQRGRQVPSPLAEQGDSQISLPLTEHIDNAAFYRGILENMIDVYYRTDPEGNLTLVSPSGATLLGVSSVDDLLGLNLARDFYYDPNARSLLLEKLRQDGVVHSYEVMLKRKDGTLVVGETTSRLLLDPQGNPLGVEGIFRDLTEKKRAQEALRASKAKYQQLFESCPDGIAITSLSGQFLDANHALLTMLDYSIDELCQKNMAQMTPQKWNEPEQALLQSLLAAPLPSTAADRPFEQEQPIIAREKELFRRDGSSIPVMITWWVMRDAQQQPEAFGAFLHDISARKKAAQERRTLEDRLQHAQRMEALGTLAGGVAHDFNNLLMIIQGNISLMRLDLPQTHHHQHDLKVIEQAVNDGVKLSRQLLGLAQHGSYQVSTIDLNQLVSITTDLFGRTHQELSLQQRLAEPLGLIRADAAQIEQVVLNVLINAWQAMPDGGPISIETEPIVLNQAFVSPYQVPPGTYAKLSITDRGVGIDEQDLPHIFDPFFTSTGTHRGAGLGLAAAYGIVKSHRGIITVSSTKGQGTCFSVYFPTISEPTIHDPTPVTNQLVKGQGRILLIDDDETILTVGKRMLESIGYEVMTAAGGRQGLHLYQDQAQCIDLVILDMIMPGLKGGETFDKLKAINPEIKVLLASGYSQTREVTDILARGCRGFLQKPFDLFLLSQKIHEVLFA